MKKFSGIQGFPERLNRALDNSNKTFGQVCRETGISRTTLYDLRTGNRGPTASQVARLSSSLGISADWLLGLHR